MPEAAPNNNARALARMMHQCCRGEPAVRPVLRRRIEDARLFFRSDGSDIVTDKETCMTKRPYFIVVVFFTLLYGSLGAADKKKQVSVEGLIYDLQHPDSDRRKQAAATVGQNKLREAVSALIAASEDSSRAVRFEATRALVRINDPRALEALIRLTHDTNRNIQEKAIEGIINIYVVEEDGFIHSLKQFVDLVNPFSDDYNPLMVEPYVPVSENAVAALADLLASPETGMRQDAAVALGILRARSALPAIEKALKLETKDAVKVELIRSVYKIGDPNGGQSVIPLVRDPDKKVHDEAILTLGVLRVQQAAPSLKELYESGVEERKKIFGFVPVTGSDDLQKKLLKALAYIGDMSCEGLFLSAVQDSRDSYRRYGAEGLGRIGNTVYTTDVARSYLRESSGSVRLAMSYALFRLGREEHLIELVDNVDKEQVLHYLLELPPQDIEKLYPYLSSETDSTKIRLLEVVGQRGDQSALSIVEGMTANENPEVASAANLALRRLRGRVTS